MTATALPALPKRPIEHYELNWRGIAIRITYSPDAHGSPADSYHYSRLEIETYPSRGPLPITESGYKSQHPPGGEIEAAGGPVTYVTQWLNSAASSREWKQFALDQRQGSLF